VNAEWFYSVGDTRQGPVTEEDLRRLAADGKLQKSDLVWKDGMKDWVEARSVEMLFPRKGAGDDDRPSRRRFDPEGERPGRSKRADDYDNDRPSRRGRQDEEDDDDRPRVRRDDWADEYEDRPRRKKLKKPGQIQAIAIMMLVGGILGILVFLGFAASCIGLVWPGIYFELVVSIMCIVRAANMLGRDDQGPPKTLSILMIICIVNLDVINCVLGIVCIVMLSAPEVVSYYRRKGFES
jgi:GYF domain 2